LKKKLDFSKSQGDSKCKNNPNIEQSKKFKSNPNKINEDDNIQISHSN